MLGTMDRKFIEIDKKGYSLRGRVLTFATGLRVSVQNIDFHFHFQLAEDRSFVRVIFDFSQNPREP